jgi:hypothetical protein
MFGKKTVLTASVSLSLIVLMFSAMTASAEYSVGVKAGDWTGYGDVSVDYASNMPGYEDPPSWVNMSWSCMEALDVQDGNVTVQSTTIYKNGTEEAEVVWGNVASGEGNLSVGIIPSNLGAGDEIPANVTDYTEEPLKLTINGTVTRSYAGANRKVNYANITSPIIHGNVTYGTQNMSFYWDKKSGVMCEQWYSYFMSYMVNTTQYYYNMSMFWKMTATNMWPAVFTVQDGYTFNVTMLSNSTISDFNFDESVKQLSFNVTGPAGKAGYCNITIPKDFLQGDPWTLLLNTTDWTSSCTITENATHTFVYVPYTHSTNTIQITGTWVIPEFPPAIILPLLMFFAFIAVALPKKKSKCKAIAKTA